MEQMKPLRRDVLQGLVALAATGFSPAVGADHSVPAAGDELPTTPHARATYRALIDAVLPRTPALADELGPDHVPGGLEVGLDEDLIAFMDNLITVAGSDEVHMSAPLSEPVAVALDGAAAKLLASGENEDEPSVDRVLEVLDTADVVDTYELSEDPERSLEQSLFASLSREDRLRAIGKLDRVDVDTAALPGPAAEFDAALIGQLAVGFTQVIYYSEWTRYEDPYAAPGERKPSDEEIQGWVQTDFPGIINGATVLRGYWSKPGTSLGEGAVWETLKPSDNRPIQLREAPGSFRENDYETSDYEEVYTTDGNPPGEIPLPVQSEGIHNRGSKNPDSVDGDVTETSIGGGD